MLLQSVMPADIDDGLMIKGRTAHCIAVALTNLVRRADFGRSATVSVGGSERFVMFCRGK